jgi:hypothetical protein
MRDPADKATLGSSTNTQHLYFDLQGFIYSFRPISTAVLVSPRADWEFFRCYLAVTLLSSYLSAVCCVLVLFLFAASLYH